jgi:DNA repair protein RadD
MAKALRPHQEKAIALLRASLGSGHRRPMIQAPTGFGKTVLASTIVQGALAKRKRVIFTVPSVDLVEQTVEAFWADGIRDVGVLQGNHPMTDYSRPVQIASLQTLARRGIPAADIVVVDEAHRRYDSLTKWMTDPNWQRVPFVGLSATPWAKGLGKDFDDLIIASTTAELIEQGYLSKFRVFAPSHPDLTGVKTVAGDYHEGQLSVVMQDGKLVADVVETWLTKGEDRPTLVFAVDRAHAKKLQTSFLAAGVPTGYIDGHMTREERKPVRDDFAAGRLRVVCNVGCLTTGVDWDVRCIVLARPTRSEILFTQIIGRGLRTAPGKADCLVLDHSDTHLRLGFVTDIQHDRLDTGNGTKSDAERDEPLPKECPKCTYLRPPRIAVCPACGFKPEPKSKIECEAGELVELRGKKKPAPPTMAEKQAFYSELLGYADDRGWRRGWAANKYRKKFGVWPKGLDEVALEPSTTTRNWIKAQQIAWANAQKAAQGVPAGTA